MTLSGIIYHEEEKSRCGRDISTVKVNSTQFLISDPIILRKQKLLCRSKDTNVSYILIYDNITNSLTAVLNSLNGRSCFNTELITETAEIVIRKSVTEELEKKKANLTISRENNKPDAIKVKSPVKSKPKFTNRSSKVIYERKKKLMRDNINDEKKYI